MYRAVDDGTAGLKPAQVASLEELRPRLESVRALVTMRTDVPLDVAAVFKERVPKVAETFMEDEMDEDPDREPRSPCQENCHSPRPRLDPHPERVPPAASETGSDRRARTICRVRS